MRPLNQVKQMNGCQEPNILVTPQKRSGERAVANRMKQLSPKIFGIFTPVPYDLCFTRKVLIPYELLVFSYEIQRNRDKKKSLFDRCGNIGIVFDVNEVHAFHFDLSDEIELIQMQESDADGAILPDQCTKAFVEEKSLEVVHRKFLQRVYLNTGTVKLLSREKFYRPAMELSVTAAKKELIRYAYLDGFCCENEQIGGLKVRLTV